MKDIGFEYSIGFMNFNNHKEDFVGGAKELRDAKICAEMKHADTLRNGVFFIDSEKGRYIFSGSKWYEPVNGKMNGRAVVYDVREDDEVYLEDIWN